MDATCQTHGAYMKLGSLLLYDCQQWCIHTNNSRTCVLKPECWNVSAILPLIPKWSFHTAESSRWHTYKHQCTGIYADILHCKESTVKPLEWHGNVNTEPRNQICLFLPRRYYPWVIPTWMNKTLNSKTCLLPGSNSVGRKSWWLEIHSRCVVTLIYS